MKGPQHFILFTLCAFVRSKWLWGGLFVPLLVPCPAQVIYGTGSRKKKQQPSVAIFFLVKAHEVEGRKC